jgi:hypothetical protein
MIFNIAVDTAKRMTSPRREGGKREALVSVVFAAVSLEAFLNELIELAQDYADTEDASSAAFAQLMSDLEKLHSSIEIRFQMAHWLLTNGPYDAGSRPYQDFKLLFQVRNDLVHFKPDPLVEEGEPRPEHSTLEKLRSRNILNDSTAPESNRSWIHVIGTKAVAEWACNTASRVTADLVSKLPVGIWGETVEKVTRKISTVQFPG